MQELTTAPQTTSPYTPAGGSNMPALTAAQPKLGTPIPGTTGGLAAKPGLTVYDNPLSQELQSNPQQSAQQAQSYGRGEDTMLIHMTPEEVNSLQGLAMAHGGSLTINPHTGLPEAGWLGKLLPTILGAVGMAFGIPPIWMGVGGAAVGTAITGDLGKGLSMGLQAYGGASLGGAAGIGGKLGHVGQGLGLSGSSAMAMHPTGDALLSSFDKTFSTGATGGFSGAAKAGLGSGILSKAAVPLAVSGALGGLSEASKPNLPTYTPEKQTPYVPMGPGKREVRFQTPEQMRQSGGAEFTYFTPSNPDPVPLSQSQQNSPLTDEITRDYGYADGGLAALPPPEGFNDLINYFGATNPGAITASMYPTSAAATQTATTAAPTTGRERIYDFSGRTTTTGATGVTNTTSGYPFTGADMGMVGGNVPFAGYRPLDPIPAAPTFNYLSDQPDFGANMSDADKKFIADNEAATKANIQSVWGPGGFLERQGTLGSVAGAPAVQDAAPVLPAGKGGNVASGATPGANYTNGGFSGYFGADGTFNGSGPSGPLGGPQMGMTPPTGTPNTNLDGSPVAVYDYGAQAAPVAAPNYDYADMSAYSPYNFDFGNFSMPYARGGEVNMGDGSFVMDARAVSELGNGSSNAGREILARLGGRPLNGPGDGVSDSIPARIGGSQKARVARDEVIMPPEAVRRIGGGDEKRGTQKLYALMDKAHKARKNAKRGQDTKLAKGLGALI